MANPEVFVLVADAAKARSFRLQENDEPGSESVRLVEERDWAHPEARVPEHARYQDSHRGGSGAQTNSFDDHRGAHDDDARRRFAALVAEGVADVVGRCGAPKLVVCAPHSMIGHFKVAWDGCPLSRVATEWLTAEVSERSTHALHEFLAERGAVPQPKAPRIQRG